MLFKKYHFLKSRIENCGGSTRFDSHKTHYWRKERWALSMTKFWNLNRRPNIQMVVCQKKLWLVDCRFFLFVPMVSVFNREVSKPWSRIILLLGIELDTGRARQSCILFFHIVFFHCRFNYSLLLLFFLPSLKRQKYHPQSTYYNVIAREEVIVNIPWQQIFNYIYFLMK